MLRTVETLIEGFRTVESETLEKHAPEIETILKEIKIIGRFWHCTHEYTKSHREFAQKYLTSLTFGCENELIRTSAYTLFLSLNALYRSAKENIRYMLESILQSSYIDINHPDTSVATKWEILKEIGNKREYRSANLITSWKHLKFKDDLHAEYKLLSEQIHPSHVHARAIFSEVIVESHIPAMIEREEIQNVSNSLLKLYDIFYFLILASYPELKDVFAMDEDIKKMIERYDFKLLRVSLFMDPTRKKEKGS